MRKVGDICAATTLCAAGGAKELGIPDVFAVLCFSPALKGAKELRIPDVFVGAGVLA